MTEEKLVATIERRRSGARVIKLAGVLDEDNGLGELIEKVGTGNALINLSGVERINSTGARDWVNWLASLEARGIKPVLVACSPAVVAQLNTVKNFAGNATVKSFHVQYRCEQCEYDKLLLVHVADLGPFPVAPACACDGCGTPMTFADESGSYFAFVREQKANEAKNASAPELARGSSSAVIPDRARRSSTRPLLRDSKPSLSAFQIVEARRPSERFSEPQVLVSPRTMPSSGNWMLISIVLLLLSATAVLIYLLMGN